MLTAHTAKSQASNIYHSLARKDHHTNPHLTRTDNLHVRYNFFEHSIEHIFLQIDQQHTVLNIV